MLYKGKWSVWLLAAHLLGIALLLWGNGARAQSPPLSGELSLDYRVRFPAEGPTTADMYDISLRSEASLAHGLRLDAWGTRRYGLYRVQEAYAEKDWGARLGRAQAGLIRLPFGIYDTRETYASGLIDYPLARGDFGSHSVDWGTPGFAWHGGSPQFQLEAAGFNGKATGIWNNQAWVRGGAARAQTYLSGMVLGVSRWDGALQDDPTSHALPPVHLTGIDLRLTRDQLLIRGEYLFGVLGGSRMRGWYVDAYYRLPGREHWSLVGRVEGLKPDDSFGEHRQLTLGIRAVASRDLTLSLNWRRSNTEAYPGSWAPAALTRGDFYFQAYRRLGW